MQFKKRLHIHVAVYAGAALLICFMLFTALQRVKHAIEAETLADNIIRSVFERSTFREDYLRTNSARAKLQWFARHEQIGRLLQSAAEEFTNAEDRETVSALIRNHESVGKLFQNIVENREKRRQHPDSPLLTQERENRLLTQLVVRLYEMTLHTGKLQNAGSELVLVALQETSRGIVSVLAIVIAAAAISSWSLSRKVADRVSRLRSGAVTIGEGDLDYRIAVDGDDEFTEIAAAFNAMTAKLSGSYHKLEKEIEDRTQAEAALRESEERLRLHVENTPLAVIEWDRNFMITRWAGEAERIFGWSAAETVGKPISSLQMVFIEDIPLVDRTIARLTDGVTQQVVAINRNYTKSGAVRCCTWYNSVLADRQGRMSSVLSMVTDITELTEAREELLKARDELEMRVKQRTEELDNVIGVLHGEIEVRKAVEKNLLAANMSLNAEIDQRLQAVESLRKNEQMLIHQSRQAAMGEMIGNIAHQWRQPLNILGLTTQELLLCYDLGEFNRETLEKSVNRSMELICHMSKTIDDFRNYFRTDKTKIDFKAREAVVKTLSLLEGSFNEQLIRAEIIAEDDPVINGYPNEFAQALLNILLNAKDVLVERKTENPAVTIGIRSADGGAVVTVRDNGGGVPAEILDKIFDPYFSTKGPQQGTGVGLFMSKSIIEKSMGGRLTVRNRGDGAEFRIEV